MNMHHIDIMLADDDKDDCNFFREALEELPFLSKLTTLHDGQQLLQHLSQTAINLPDVLFLDLNMPRKSGFDCLTEIKANNQIKSIPVIILSTSLEHRIANLLYKNGARHYIRKPSHFSQLKQIIHLAINKVIKEKYAPLTQDNFIISL